MIVATKKLKDAGVDVAGGISEVFLNNFASAHQKHNQAVYSGQTLVKEFSDWIKISYQVQNPMEFSFGSIPLKFFQKVWEKHLIVKGADPIRLSQSNFTAPPNLGISSDKVKFTVDVYDGSDTSNTKLSVSFEWDLLGRVAVYLKDEGPNKRSVRLEPVKISFSLPPKAIERDIQKAISKIAGDRHPAQAETTAWDVSDPVWCAKVEQLILLLLNNVISTQIANFVREFQLPRAVELVEGVSLQPDFLLLDGGYLIVGGQIVHKLHSETSESQKIFQEVVREYQSRTDLEVAPFPGDLALSATDTEIAASEAVDWLHEKANECEEEVLEISSSVDKVVHEGSKYDENIFVASNDDLFDSVAKKELSFADGWHGEKRLDRIVKAEAGWSARVHNGSAKIINSGIAVSADAEATGYARVCHFDFDPKNFGGWLCHGPCVRLKFHPHFGLEAFPEFSSKGIFFRARLTTKGIAINFCNWPSWANRILGWITAVLTSPIFNAIRIVVSLFRIKVLSYPLHFPGTGIEWDPRINKVPRNEEGYLIFGGDPLFN